MTRIHTSRWLRGVTAVALLLAGRGAAAGDPLGQPGADTSENLAFLLSVEELGDRPGGADLRVVDVRPPERYAAGHLPGAVSLPVAEITRTRNGVPGMLAPLEEVARILGERGISRESHVVIYDDFGGRRATRLFWALDYLGHSRLSVLQGGIEAWQSGGRPVTRSASVFVPVRYRAIPDPTRLADRAWVAARLDDPFVVLVDTRSPVEFHGQISGRNVPRAGHIPGAVNVDWVRNVTTAGPRKIKEGAELARLYGQAGVTPAKEILVYCRTGARASHTYFVLRLLGYPHVRLYDGSFVEWAADRRLPVLQ